MNDSCTSASGTRKLTYRSPAKARRAARLTTGGSRTPLIGRQLHGYKCATCGLWHLATGQPRGTGGDR